LRLRRVARIVHEHHGVEGVAPLRVLQIHGRQERQQLVVRFDHSGIRAGMNGLQRLAGVAFIDADIIRGHRSRCDPPGHRNARFERIAARRLRGIDAEGRPALRTSLFFAMNLAMRLKPSA
jgi:hypothetical protein